MTTRAYDTLYRWARRTTTSFAELWLSAPPAEEPSHPADGLVYRMKSWPLLPHTQRTATVYRALSVMSQRPVNRSWLVSHMTLEASEIDKLLERLVRQGAVEAVDVTKFAAEA